MRNKMRTMLLLFLFSTIGFCVPAYALDSDLSYNYKTENQEEFVIVGKSNINIQGRYRIISGIFMMYHRRQSMIQSMGQMWWSQMHHPLTTLHMHQPMHLSILIPKAQAA